MRPTITIRPHKFRTITSRKFPDRTPAANDNSPWSSADDAASAEQSAPSTPEELSSSPPLVSNEAIDITEPDAVTATPEPANDNLPASAPANDNSPPSATSEDNTVSKPPGTNPRPDLTAIEEVEISLSSRPPMCPTSSVFAPIYRVSILQSFLGVFAQFAGFAPR
jgi:hypothetical protein